METKHEISKNLEFGACNIPKKNREKKKCVLVSSSIPCWPHRVDPFLTHDRMRNKQEPKNKEEPKLCNGGK